MMRRIFLLVLLMLCVRPCRGDDAEKAEQQIGKARDKYQDLMTAIREDVVKQIDAQDAAERKRPNPNLKRLSQLEEEKKLLEQKWAFPGWIDVKTASRIQKAREPLIAALVKAKGASVRSGDEVRGAKLDVEIWKILSLMPPAFEDAKRGQLVLEVRRDGNVLKFTADGKFTGTLSYPFNKGTWHIGPASQLHVLFADGVSRGALEQHAEDAVTVVGANEKWYLVNPNAR